MSERAKSALWFCVSAVIVAGLLAALAVPLMGEVSAGATQSEATTALVIFALGGGIVVGAIVYLVRRLVRRPRRMRAVGQ